MIKEIKMPNLGTTTNEMKIVNWHKKVDEQVERGEILFEVETDKAVMEVESYLSGYLKKIVVDESGTVTTGDIVAYIGKKEDTLEQENEAHNEKSTGDMSLTHEVVEKKRESVRISPMVKKIADKLGVDYRTITGSGPNGMITKEDVEKASITAPKDDIRLEKFDRIGKATANAMTISKTTIPHVYFTVDINATSMTLLREETDKAVSYNSMILKAVAQCIKKYPYFASKYSDEGRIFLKDINIGLAVARGKDLLVPVIKGLDENLGFEEIEKKIKTQVEKVNKDILKQEDISGGVFTVTNLGGYGIDSFSAVINPPEAAILAVGRIDKKVVIDNNKIDIQPVMKVTLSVDHRIINGAYAAEFLQAFKEFMEGVAI